MTSKILTLGFAFVLLLLSFSTLAQNAVPGIRTQKTYGGTSGEYNPKNDSIPWVPKLLVRNSDGGYYIGTSSFSNNGQITGNHGNVDSWIARLDADQNIVWSKTIGGNTSDNLGAIQPGIDGGVIIIGTTQSSDGDMTGNHGLQDIFLFKYDDAGNLQWKKFIGGSGHDRGYYVQKVGNMGYIITGSSYSSDGNIVPSAVGKGNGDVYVALLDPAGNFIWQKRYGGNDYESGYVVKPTSDGGFVVGGTAQSWNGDVIGFHGWEDIWVLKLNSSGDLSWSKTIGGSMQEMFGDVEEDKDGGFVIAGSSLSDSGQVGDNHGDFDGIVAKLSPSGTLSWVKSYGGTGLDFFADLVVEPDNSYTVIGNTGSNNGQVTGNKGIFDVWLVRVNSDGNLVWQKTYGGSALDEGLGLVKTGDGEYAATGITISNDGDVSGNHGQSDIWLFNLGTINTIAGRIFYDNNLNNVFDVGDVLTNEATVSAIETGYTKSAVPSNGIYKLEVDTGSFVISAAATRPYYNVSPSSAAKNYSTYFNVDSVHFALQPIAGKQDLTISLVPITAILRPGFDAQNILVYKNVGTSTVTSPVIKYKPDPKMILKTTNPAYTSIVNDTLIWNLSSLAPNASGQIELNFRVSPPPTVNLGDTLKTLAFIDPVAGDLTPLDDTARLVQGVRGSYDPNDKTEANGGAITPAHVQDGKALSYLIRFQNTGTDTAFTVVVRDTLGPEVNWASLEMVQTSHPGQLEIKNGNQLTWTFNDIKLVDSNTNEPLSHGYIAYRIKPVSTLVIGDTVKNSASIYFDYNLPVLTNTEKTIVQVFVALPVNLSEFRAVRNGKTANLLWKTAMENKASHFEIERSANGADFSSIGKVKAKNAAHGSSYQYGDLQPLPGYNYYRLKMVDIDGSFKYSSIVLLNFSETAVLISSMYPNPAMNRLVLELTPAQPNQLITVSVYDQVGRVYFQKRLALSRGVNKTVLDLGAMATGTYFINLKGVGTNETHQVIIKR